MPTKIMQKGALVGFSDVVTINQAQEILKQNGISFNLTYRTESRAVVYFNQDRGVNVASYFPDTGILTILRRPDYWREDGYILLD